MHQTEFLHPAENRFAEHWLSLEAEFVLYVENG
jgi:hypothetical protein